MNDKFALLSKADYICKHSITIIHQSLKYVVFFSSYTWSCIKGEILDQRAVIVVLQGCIIALVNYFCKHPLSAMGSRHSKKGNINLKVESTLNLKVTIVSGY